MSSLRCHHFSCKASWGQCQHQGETKTRLILFGSSTPEGSCLCSAFLLHCYPNSIAGKGMDSASHFQDCPKSNPSEASLVPRHSDLCIHNPHTCWWHEVLFPHPKVYVYLEPWNATLWWGKVLLLVTCLIIVMTRETMREGFTLIHNSRELSYASQQGRHAEGA